MGIQGQLRTWRLALEDKYKKDVGPTDLLMHWAPRHAAWIQQRLQARPSGKTTCYSQRKQDYKGGLAIFGECVLFKVLTDDKMEERWRPGVSVGKDDQTDEFVLVTPDGVRKSRSIERQIAETKIDVKFLDQYKGLPWSPAGKPDGAPISKQSDPLVAGARLRRMYITPAMIQKYGPTEGCPKCENYGPSHSEECRRRLEEKMIQAGEAFRTGGPQQGEKRLVVEVHTPGEAATPCRT